MKPKELKESKMIQKNPNRKYLLSMCESLSVGNGIGDLLMEFSFAKVLHSTKDTIVVQDEVCRSFQAGCDFGLDNRIDNKIDKRLVIRIDKRSDNRIERKNPRITTTKLTF